MITIVDPTKEITKHDEEWWVARLLIGNPSPLWSRIEKKLSKNHSISHKLGSEWVSKRTNEASSAEQANERAMRVNERTHEWMAQYLHLDSWLFWTPVLLSFSSSFMTLERKGLMMKGEEARRRSAMNQPWLSQRDSMRAVVSRQWIVIWIYFPRLFSSLFFSFSFSFSFSLFFSYLFIPLFIPFLFIHFLFFSFFYFGLFPSILISTSSSPFFSSLFCIS